MKKYINIIVSILITLMMFSSCEKNIAKIEENENSNFTTEAVFKLGKYFT